MGIFAADALGRAKSGRVFTVYCGDVELGRRQIRSATEELDSIPTLVALEWDHAPSLARELDEIQAALADAAASLWPNWYITAEQRFERERAESEDVANVVAEATRLSAGVSSSWLREAWQLCRRSKRPLVRDMASADQVRQLARALDPKRLVFSLSVGCEEATPVQVRGVARAAEWLAREAQAKTLLLVPNSWQGNVELDHVNYGGMVLRTDEGTAKSLSVRPPNLGEATEASEPSLESRVDPLPNVSVGPVAGKPHPGSEVERLVYECISADTALCALFQYNQRLSANGKNYIVDLVWREGGLVVELDGPEHHSQLVYAKDRERDFHLYVSGYSTLRIPNAQICVDVETAIQRIRTMVQYLKTRDTKVDQR